jgi:ferric-dicitrate binding protein FerR (iron transport regulator)
MDKNLLEKYFSGACSPEEVEQVLDWFKSTELNAAQEQEMLQLWQAPELEKEAAAFASADQVLARIQEALTAQKQGYSSGPQAGREESLPPKKQAKWKFLLKVAAVLAPVCFWWLFLHPGEENQAATRLVSMAAAPGRQRTLHLADGSTITLNAGSKVSYHQPFQHKREIILRGEAFFEVAKDSLHPFIVKTGVLTTQALGTSFNIKYRPKEADILVTLLTGVVKIEKEGSRARSQIARLKPGQQLVYNKGSQGYKVDGYDQQEVISWRRGILYFKQADVDQVVEKLESWYGIDVELIGRTPEQGKAWTYTGSYQSQNLESVLEGIAFVNHITYEIAGKKVSIKFKPKNPSAMR